MFVFYASSEQDSATPTISENVPAVELKGHKDAAAVIPKEVPAVSVVPAVSAVPAEMPQPIVKDRVDPVPPAEMPQLIVEDMVEGETPVDNTLGLFYYDEGKFLDLKKDQKALLGKMGCDPPKELVDYML